MKKILVVDDDPRLRELVRLSLEGAGFSVITASNGRQAVTHVGREAPALVVLDVGLPDEDGFAVCRRIRETSDVPILFLTAHDSEVDRILGLELGADDYVTKPFSPREVVARIRAILKRTGGAPDRGALSHGALVVDSAAHSCVVADTEVSLTATEFGLLSVLMRRPSQVFGREQLIAEIWGDGAEISDRTLDSHLRNLRSKLGRAGWRDAIETLHGVGVKMGKCEAAHA